jgi:hypothetical protein
MKAHMRLSSTRKKRERLNQPALNIQANALPDAVIQGLVDDWIVPTIVDQIIKAMVKRGDPVDPEVQLQK